MTELPADFALFDVPPPPTPVERLLHLADEYTRHNDALDLLPRATDPPTPDPHTASAQRLAATTWGAIEAIWNERLYASVELSETVARLKQLALLTDVSADRHPRIARKLTTLARETRRRRPATAPVPDDRLNAVQRTALAEIACGHVVCSGSLGREYTRSREPKVSISTLRTLEALGLAERTARSAPPAYIDGPPLDRVRLTSAGVTTLASVIGTPSASPGTTARTTPRPLPTTAQAAVRSR